MADNRNFFDHIQNEGGAPVYVEDKKLAETTSQSSLAATDSVMLKGTDGTFHAIDKSSFDEAVRASMGSILAQIDKTTNVSRIPVLGTDSNDLGSTTPANLATLLGVNHLYFEVASGASATLPYTDRYLHIMFDGSSGTNAVCMMINNVVVFKSNKFNFTINDYTLTNNNRYACGIRYMAILIFG